MKNNFEENLQNALLKFNINFQKLDEQKIRYFYNAFTHSSYSNEHKNLESYQYLEFLGDSVLGFVVSDHIFDNYKNFGEGKATKLKSEIVDKNALGFLSKYYGFPNCLRTGKSAFANGKGIKSDSDLIESFIGACYKAYGLEFTKEIIYHFIDKILKKFHNSINEHPKTKLQELVQSNWGCRPRYEDQALNNGKFESKVFINNNLYGEGIGQSKKESQTKAASDALKKMAKI